LTPCPVQREQGTLGYSSRIDKVAYLLGQGEKLNQQTAGQDKAPRSTWKKEAEGCQLEEEAGNPETGPSQLRAINPKFLKPLIVQSGSPPPMKKRELKRFTATSCIDYATFWSGKKPLQELRLWSGGSRGLYKSSPKEVFGKKWYSSEGNWPLSLKTGKSVRKGDRLVPDHFSWNRRGLKPFVAYFK